MLPFGSITSVVPLVVLGFAYLVYLGAILLNKPAANELQLTEVAVNIIEADASDYSASSIPDFRYLIDHDDVCTASDNEIIKWEHFRSVLHELPPQRQMVLHNVSQFLPRPPPVC